MSENFQNPSVLGTAHSLQLPLSMVNNAASLTGRLCNYSRVSAPAASAAWHLPSTSGTSFQPLMGSAYLDQCSSRTMLPGVSGQSQMSTSAVSYPSVLEWDIAGSTEEKSSMGDFTGTVTDQDTAVSSMSMVARYEITLDTNIMVSLYPSLSASHVERTPSQVPNKSLSLSLPDQEGSQVHYYHQGTQGPPLSGELDPCLQCYGSMSYTGGRGSALQTYSNTSPEMDMVLKEVQASSNRPPDSTSGIYYSVLAQPITEFSYQVMNSLGMEASLALQPSGQTFCLTQTSELPESCSSRNQILERNPPPELGDVPIIAPAQRSLALPSATTQEQTDKSLDEMKIGLSKSLDTLQIPIENQDPPLCPLATPNIHQLLACIHPLSQEQQPGSETTGQEKNGLCFEDPGTLESGTESGGSRADITTLVEDIHLPQLLDCLKELDQCKDLQAMNTADTIILNQVQENSRGTKGPSHPTQKNKNKTSEPLEGEPKAKIPPKDPECLPGGEVIVCNAAVSDRCPVTMAKQNSKPQKAASSRISKTKSHGQEKTKKARENSKKAEESKQPGNKVRAKEKPTTARMKHKKSEPELCQEAFKKPRSCPGMHMLESVQVFHALGKKSDQKPGFSSSRVLGSSKKLHPSSAVKPWLGATKDGKGLEETQVRAQKPSSSAQECSFPSQYELPPPGKVKLVPLPFLTMEKPRARPVPRRPQSLASHRPAAAHPARPGSTNSAQPTASNSSRPTTASLPGPAKPVQPISTNPSRPGLLNPTSRPILQPATSRPAPYRTTASTSLQREPLPVSVTKRQAPPKSQSQFLLQDFRFQPIPWRKPNVPQPVMSKPITKEQRPEREALKRKAQQERENAAKCTSLGKVHIFIKREKEMDLSRHYGYVM